MKKIAIVTDAWSKNVSGVVTSILHTKKELEKKGFSVSIIHPGMFRSIPLPSYSEIRLAIFSKRKISKLLKEIKPDYIHISTEGTLGLTARNACVKNGWNFTTAYHTRLPEYVEVRVHSLKKTTYKYLRWFHSKSKKIIVSTDSLKKELEAKNFKNIVTIPLGVDLELFKKNKKALIPEGLKKPIFTFLGRVAPEKNITAFLGCRLPGTKLIIGDGPHKEKLEKKYKTNTVFVGFKKGKDLIDLLSISDVFVFPSKTDTFGLVLVEALACGLPIAAYNVQGPKNIITNGFDGFLGANLAENAKKCLKINKENCRKTARKYSWKIYASKFIRSLVHV